MRLSVAMLAAALSVGAAGCRVSRQERVSDSESAVIGMAVAERLDSARVVRSLCLDSLRVTVEYVDSPRRRVICEAARAVAVDTAVAVARGSATAAAEMSSVSRESKSTVCRPRWAGMAAAFAAGVLAAWLTLRSLRRRGRP